MYTVVPITGMHRHMSHPTEFINCVVRDIPFQVDGEHTDVGCLEMGSAQPRYLHAGTVAAVTCICAVCTLVLSHIVPGVMHTTGGCIMTFMLPSYQPLPISDLHRQYTLERYIEGSTRQQICVLPLFWTIASRLGRCCVLGRQRQDRIPAGALHCWHTCTKRRWCDIAERYLTT